MDIKQIITDYIRRSILTAEGDLVVRGAAVPEALAAAAVGQVLKSAGEDTIPAWGVPSIGDFNTAMGLVYRDAAGADAQTGLGFQPSLIILFAVDDVAAQPNLSIGFSDVTNNYSVFLNDSAAEAGNSNVYAVYVMQAAGTYLRGAVTAFGVDGFTITWDISGVQTLNYLYFAIG